MVVRIGDFGQGLGREFAPSLLRQSAQPAAALYHAGAVACPMGSRARSCIVYLSRLTYGDGMIFSHHFDIRRTYFF